MWTIVEFTNIQVEVWKGPSRHCNLFGYRKCEHFIPEVKCWTELFLSIWEITLGILCRIFPVFINSTNSHFCNVSSCSWQCLFLFMTCSYSFHMLLLLFSFSLWPHLPHLFSCNTYVCFCVYIRCLYGEIKLISSAYS